ncbi:hypothetical protein ACFLR2_02015 [Chlamydiota bacterium]
MDYSTLLPQIKSLHAQVPKSRVLKVLIKTLFASTFPREKNKKTLAYSYLTRLLWEYIAETLPPALLQIPEPKTDDAQPVLWNKRPVSQELAAAILDFHAITSTLQNYPIKTVLAIGANQWQLGYVFLQQMPHLKYIVSDAPAALQTAQECFKRAFPEKKIFAYRSFENYEKIRTEFEESSLCFVEPAQLSLLPPRSIDLGITIDVLDKLTRGETDAYFAQLASLINGYFYFKEQKISLIKEADYRVPDDWEEVFWRTCPLYPLSFEALFESTSARSTQFLGFGQA